MFVNEDQNQDLTKHRTRRNHQKSRTGCKECKRRRIKCDEKRPACTRCVLSLQSCVYSPGAQFVAESGGRDELSLPNVQRTVSLSPNPPSSVDNSSPSEASAYSTPALTGASSRNEVEDSFPPSDTALYHHYLQHTSHASTYYQNDKAALEIYIPTLALQSPVVFHSILALSAACLSRDMIAEGASPDAVSQVLMAGYRHYNRASEQTRDLISQLDTPKPEHLLASTPLLIGFATASQQINYWLESRKSTRDPGRRLPASLRDTVILSKGLRATLHALRRGEVSSSQNMGNEAEVANETVSHVLTSNPPPAAPPPSQTHAMYPVFAATSEEAFSRLQERLDSTSLSHAEDSHLAACVEAFQRLSTIRDLTFSSPTPPTPLSMDNASRLPQLAPWLRSYIGRPIMRVPNEPLTRPFLTFLTQAPQEYLDLLLPLLDESLESPMEVRPDDLPELTEVQALALDIWAHWCVLMFLVEEEAWWIGNLPCILLTGMLNRYGDDFVGRLWPDQEQGQDEWWPASMLACLREVKRCQ